jgi:hypothetical protein
MLFKQNSAILPSFYGSHSFNHSLRFKELIVSLFCFLSHNPITNLNLIYLEYNNVFIHSLTTPADHLALQADRIFITVTLL